MGKKQKPSSPIHQSKFPTVGYHPGMTIRNKPVPIKFFGEIGIDFDEEVVDQMTRAAMLPVTEKAAIMPDGHLGYALPIGGVVGLDNAVSPSFVGYDIACRMTLTILGIPVSEFKNMRSSLTRDMQSVTRFGVGGGYTQGDKKNHPVIEEPLWNQIPILKEYKTLAHLQLGSSGGGNHFFDAVEGEVVADSNWLGLPVGEKFIAIMTHSGSRGAGNKLAQHYIQLASREIQKLASGIPHGYEWLRLDSDPGREYWDVMQLMGRYAQANHTLIHDAFLQKTGLKQIARFENHHNFAFLENGLVVPRKGATPAQKGKAGIIPGSSGTFSYLVEGLGNESGLDSSSHGAGRIQSRKASKKAFDRHSFSSYMKFHDILSIGVAGDETYKAYKDIEHVMALQEGILVRTIARMKPLVVIMGGGRADDGD